MLFRSNKDIGILRSRVKNLYCFIGTNRKTDGVLVVDKKALFNNRDEDIIYSLETKKGDGTVTVKSATIDFGETFIMEDGHTGILMNSMEYIADIYNLDRLLIKKEIIELEERPLGIVFKKHISLELRSDENIVARFMHAELITKYEFIIEEFDKNYVWVIFRDLPIGKYVLEIFVEDEEGYNIFVVGTRVEEELTYENVKKLDTGRIEFYFEI